MTHLWRSLTCYLKLKQKPSRKTFKQLANRPVSILLIRMVLSLILGIIMSMFSRKRLRFLAIALALALAPALALALAPVRASPTNADANPNHIHIASSIPTCNPEHLKKALKTSNQH